MPNPTANDAAPVAHRNLWLVGTLSLLSAGLYNIYLLFVWAREINGLAANRRYSPKVVITLMILTLGLAGTVFECFYAIDLQKLSEADGLEATNLPPIIIALNVSALVLCLLGPLALIGIPLGVAATVILQRRLNLFALAAANPRAVREQRPLTF